MNQHEIDVAEHTSGIRPLGEFPDHCVHCLKVSKCDHLTTEELRTISHRVIRKWCSDCGLNMDDECPLP